MKQIPRDLSFHWTRSINIIKYSIIINIIDKVNKESLEINLQQMQYCTLQFYIDVRGRLKGD